ncbi:MAG: ATP synthase F1 subunit delta [Planctomycetaceae bacterium]|nr:MAG: ATP synthase F1 subunit delta [Planctomycetaceae bacterium]
MDSPQQLCTRIPSVMDEPQSGAIARVYAAALLNAVPADQQPGVIEELQSFVQDVLPANPGYQRLLASAVVGRDDKLRLISNVVSGRGSELFTNFLKVLAKHNRLDLLPVICRQVGLQYEILTGKRRVQVTTAHPVSEETGQAIQQSLAQTLPYTPIVELAVDPTLLGGMRIRVGDTVYDGSLRARLKQMRHRVEHRSTHEIQSGRNRFSHSERD